MVELDNAKRSLNRAILTPIKDVPGRQDDKGNGRAVDKAAAIGAFHVRSAEIEAVRKRIKGEQGPRPLLKLVDLAARAHGSDETTSSAGRLGAMKEFAAVSEADIEAFAAALLAVRTQQADAVTDAVDGVATDLRRALEQKPPAPGSPVVPPGAEPDDTFFHPELPGTTLFKHMESRTIKATGAARKATTDAGSRVSSDATELRADFHLVLADPPAAPVIDVDSLPLTIGNLTRLVDRGLLSAEPARALSGMASELGFDATTGNDVELSVISDALKARAQLVADVIYAYTERRRVEPIGYLHLERLTFTPAGIERGELVHSVPLTPGEEVNISHKEWSNTSEEFERIVTDYLENFSEEGVTEKSELSQAIGTQHQHSSGFNMSVSATGGYGPVSISASFGYNVADSSTRSEQHSRNESNELTRKASVRTKKEHKVSFKVASAAGTEDQEVRKIKNPFTDRATRVDYYQLLRKWRVDLYRYGIRLTYDITIPEPGSDILSKIIEIRQLEAALTQGFGAPDATLPWARFDLRPDGVTRWNYQTWAALYGVAVEPPPAQDIRIVKAFSKQWASFDESKRAETTGFLVEVPQDYFVYSISATFLPRAWEGEDHREQLITDVRNWIGAGGSLTANVFTWQLSSLSLEITLTARFSASAEQAWQMRVWGALHDAAQARYEANRSNIKARLTQLQEELGAQDALTLRQMEREEVSKGVMRWMFGPDFTFVPPGVPANLYGASGSIVSADQWTTVLAHGDVIKFLHHAVEWENMLFFLYPYFWSHTTRWDLKKFLDHPDFMHRTFLRSGSARVVLTIRPGYETAFLAFLERGTMDAPLPSTHPYLTIAEEFEAFARTNYPGIRPANPVEGARPLLTPLQKATWDEMQRIIASLEAYHASRGRYPTTAEGLAALTPPGPSADRWGNAYDYRSPGRLGEYELVSLGADGAPDGDDEDADITSWAEASLIGRWYEYTPTNALDIAFNETTPTA